MAAPDVHNEFISIGGVKYNVVLFGHLGQRKDVGYPMWVYPCWIPLQPHHVCDGSSLRRDGIAENEHITWTSASIVKHGMVRITEEVKIRLAIEQDQIRGDINGGYVECLPSVLKLMSSLGALR